MANVTLPAPLFQTATQAASIGMEDHPLNQDIMDSLLDKLRRAQVMALAPAVESAEISVDLTDAEADAFRMCFEVGAEGDDEITDGEWKNVLAALGEPENEMPAFGA